jgi:ubiquinone/menaquinone biosynthesis C-methylase UbiE
MQVLCVLSSRSSLKGSTAAADASIADRSYSREEQMTEQVLRFVDGAAYEQNMGIWSRLVGQIFLDWLAPPTGLRWIDVGCGNGAFTELLIARCAPAEVQGIDPSDGQLDYARKRSGVHTATFLQGDAMAIPFADARFDAATMALVLVFVPDPRRGIEEMVRVLAPGGIAATYMWDMLGGGFPLDPVLAEMRAMGFAPTRPPRMEASQIAAMRELWTGVGFEEVETRDITVHRTFADFDEFWAVNVKAPSIGPTIAAMAAGELEKLKEGVRARVPADDTGHITRTARANAVKGRRPK